MNNRGQPKKRKKESLFSLLYIINYAWNNHLGGMKMFPHTM